MEESSSASFLQELEVVPILTKRIEICAYPDI